MEIVMLMYNVCNSIERLVYYLIPRYGKKINLTKFFPFCLTLSDTDSNTVIRFNIIKRNCISNSVREGKFL